MTTLPPLPPAEDYGYRDDNGTWVQQPLYSGTDMRAYGAACAAAEMERFRLAMNVAHGALLQCSPCAADECQQVQQEWLTDAIAGIESALKESKPWPRNNVPPRCGWLMRSLIWR